MQYLITTKETSMKRKHHNEIVDENYQDKITGEKAIGKSRFKTKKYKRPTSSMLLKSSIRKYIMDTDT